MLILLSRPRPPPAALVQCALGRAIEYRGVFKADEAAARMQRGNGSCAGAGADVSHHRADLGVGFDEILAQLHGLLRGVDAARYSNGTFDANDHISREQLAVMLWRYAGSPMTNHSLNHFTDVNSISGYARTALAWANENGIVGGIGNHVLATQGKATRAQVATMLMRMMRNT